MQNNQYAAIATLSSTTHPLPWGEHRTGTHSLASQTLLGGGGGGGDNSYTLLVQLVWLYPKWQSGCYWACAITHASEDSKYGIMFTQHLAVLVSSHLSPR